MKINKIGRRVTCPACGWRDPELHTTGKFAGWLKCRNPACGLTFHEEYREVAGRTGRKNE